MSKYSKQQITEWCKATSLINGMVYFMWCKYEAARINRKGGDAFVKENEKGEVALFRRDEYEVKEL